MTDPDAESRAAVSALVYRLRNRAGASDEHLAAEFVTALVSYGWRPPLAPAAEDGEGGAREAARELLAFACATRPDWTEEETWAAVHAARTAGLEWDRLASRLVAIALRREEPPTRPRELWDHARGITGPTRRGAIDPDLFAALKAGDYASAWAATHDGAVPPQRIRETGPQAVLAENDPGAGTVPAAGATEPTNPRR